MMQACPRCRVCERIHGLPRCDPGVTQAAAAPEPERNVTPVVTRDGGTQAPMTNAQRHAAYRARKRAAK